MQKSLALQFCGAFLFDLLIPLIKRLIPVTLTPKRVVGENQCTVSEWTNCF